MMFDVTLEEVQQVRKNITNINVEMEEKQNEIMDSGEFDDLPKLFISPIETNSTVTANVFSKFHFFFF